MQQPRRSFLAGCGLAAAALLPLQDAVARPLRRRRCRPPAYSVKHGQAPAQPQKTARSEPADSFIQPDYKKWDQVEVGMTEAEVVALLGEPLEKDTEESYLALFEESGMTKEQARAKLRQLGMLVFPWTYGRIKYTAPAIPASFDFYIVFEDKKVYEMRDPFDGNLSPDGKPTIPQLTTPKNNETFAHYPRFVDMRWTPSSGEYSIEYQIEVGYGQGDPGELEYILSDDSPVHSSVPYYATAFGGANPGRWRVKAKNRLGESAWSEFRHFRFEV